MKREASDWPSKTLYPNLLLLAQILSAIKCSLSPPAIVLLSVFVQ